ncbi:MICOS complex subunit MIC13 isoform X2 [Pelodiscus sinensis]|uniref:MICOS complex subunit MIC13 isoform X2 n=1 Tax=Pelodiscus sinensis TaxID=13735 RepID=UPI003F6BE57E
MASSRVFPVVRFVIKGSLAGAAVYVAFDQGLLGNGNRGADALKKARSAVPPAVQEWANYIGWEVPSTPKFDFSVSETWNTGVQATMSALSVAPRKIQEYTQDGWKYMKGLIK